MDHVISLVNVFVMKAMLAPSVTDVQTVFMAFQTAEVSHIRMQVYNTQKLI